MTDTVLIVDDEDGVRRTFQEWLSGVPGLTVLASSDAEQALRLANERPIDLAVLDWNLGSGSDGLQLLEDLADFQPDLIAILVTGFANQATPLEALRMGVRDYLDKNQDLTRESFLAAVERQLVKIRPAKRQREWNARLGEFRAAVQNILPLVRGQSALNEPVGMPTAIRALFHFLLKSTGAKSGALLVHGGTGEMHAYDPEGQALDLGTVSFPNSLAASVMSLREPFAIHDLSASNLGPVELFPFEKNRTSILAIALPVNSGPGVVLELFDKSNFNDADKHLLANAAEVGAELLRQAFAERHTNRMLFDAVEAALKAGDNLREASPPATEAALAQLKRDFAEDSQPIADAETELKLLEAIRELAVRYGPASVEHCLAVVQSARTLLDRTQL